MWVVQDNDVVHWSLKHFMLLADTFTGSRQWLKHSATGGPGTNRCFEENLYLAIFKRVTFIQSVCNCECVSSGNPFVLFQMKQYKRERT